MRLWAYTVRELWRRPGRTVLTVLGIVIGVAAVVSVSLASAGARDAFSNMFDQVAGRAALEVVAQARTPFDPAQAQAVESLPEVEAAVPAISVQAALLHGQERSPVLVLGIDPRVDGLVRDYVLREGALLSDETEVKADDLSDEAGAGAPVEALLEAGFARTLGLALGDEARLLTPTGLATLRVRGLLALRGAAVFNNGAVVVLPLERTQRLFDQEGRVNTVQLVLADGADVVAAQERVARVLPPGLIVQRPASRGGLADETLANTELGLSALSALALVAGAFIILNTFLMNVGERRRQLAVMRALGATRRQITRLLLREAILLGSGGTVLGLAAGAGVSAVLERSLQGLVGADTPGITLTPGPFFVGALLGPGLAVLATYIPARRAGRVEPLEGLTSGGAPGEERGPRRPRAAYGGLMLTSVATAAAVAMTAGALPLDLAPLLFALVVTGAVLSMPLVVGPLSRTWARMLSPLLGNGGTLAFRQLDRHRTRTSLTVGVLFVALVVAISMGSSLLNNVRDTVDWYERTVVGDFFVRGSLPATGTSEATSMPEGLLNEIRALPGTERVDELRFLPGTVAGMQVTVLTRTFSPTRSLPLDVVDGDGPAVLSRLLRGEVVVGSVLARTAGLAVGDQVTVQTRDGPRAYRVAGTVTEYTSGGMAVYMEWHTAKRAFGFNGADVFLVQAAEGRTAELGAALEALASRDGLMIQTMAEFRDFVSGLLDSVIGFLWMLMGVIFVVASLGVVNTLTVNVLEQTRELGLLRAVAMTRRQVRRVILYQALGLGVVSLVPGLLVGVGVAFLLNRGTAATLGTAVDFRISSGLLVGSFVATLVITQVAAYLPARRAARLEIVRALQYE